ncbi:molybdenum cofactor guanylyltransferase MobA [Ancylobacter sp. WKF20]|uniref:molybdenum cofactor guanylyltransferase MobA n=1 Tax=Ancylobacter sp. WKF20 TaxID=3039801 RepID=UPI0024342BAD|nr:molybdenum cofactor guanylyltransferase MobA [Ancylobacter sp. WKF20]WGD31324.1 molybdenum cofactor guanylyltransferase MobA [Ancylobacter sp. WKF20]
MDAPAGLILAGGLSRRMGGGDKALLRLGGETILARIARIVGPQVSPLLLNANGPAERFGLDLPVIPDSVPDRPGPLAGILAGLDHLAAHLPQARHLLTVPSDCPFLPADLAARLTQAAGRDGAACAGSGGRVHGVVGLWPVAAREDLRRLLLQDGQRRVDAWLARVGAATVDWPVTPLDPFFNVNTPDDLAHAEALAAQAS